MASLLKLNFVTVDVFTDKQYQGNPLAIVRIPHGVNVTQEQKQKIAREFNLSETTFLHENGADTKGDHWTVDIFMTSKELPFAGHPTVGTACYVLSRTAEERGITDGVIDANFTLKAGPVGLRYDVAKKTAKQLYLTTCMYTRRDGARMSFSDCNLVLPRLTNRARSGRRMTTPSSPLSRA